MEREPLLKTCLRCGKCAGSMDKCKTCKEKFRIKSYYCSRSCQEKDWEQHKLFHKQKQAGPAETTNAAYIPTEKRQEDVDENGMTILMQTVFNGSLREVEKILKEGMSDILAIDHQKLNALCYSLYRKHVGITKALLKAGGRELLHQTLQKGDTCLHLACEFGHLETVKLLIDAGGFELIIRANEDGNTCLYSACCRGKLDLIKLIVEAGGPDALLPLNKEGYTCLHAAIQFNHVEVVKFLINVGGMTLMTACKPGGPSALSFACQQGKRDLAQLLLTAGGKRLTKQRTSDGISCFNAACMSGNVELVKDLVKFMGNDVIYDTTMAGGTGLTAAAEFGHLELVKYLLEQGGDRLLRMAKKNGTTALHDASWKGHVPVLECLLARADKALLLHRKDGRDGTCLHLAALYGHVDALRVLITAPGGEELARTGTHQQPGFTPLFAACCIGHTEVVKILLAAPSGAEMAMRRQSIGSCLAPAAHGGHADVIEAILRATGTGPASRAMLVERDSEGLTPMFQACRGGYLAAVEVLARLGGETALFGTMEGTGDSCLMFSMAVRQLEVFKLLVRLGGQRLVLMKNDKGFKCMDLVAGRKEYLDVLLNV